MAPIHSRQLLAWTLPTIAVLLSYFWYKRKRIGAPSDPGETESATKEDITTEINKTDKVLGSSLTSPQQIVSNKVDEGVQITPTRSFGRSLSGVESSPIDIIIPKELRSSRTAPIVISDEDLDFEIEKVKSMKNSDPIEEFQKSRKANSYESTEANNNLEEAQPSNLIAPVEPENSNIEMAPLESKETSSVNDNKPIVNENGDVTQSSAVSSSTKASLKIEEVVKAEASQSKDKEPKRMAIDKNARATTSAKSSPVSAKGMKIEATPFECKNTPLTKINSVCPKFTSKRGGKNKNKNMSQKNIAVVEEKLNTLQLQCNNDKGAKKKNVEKNQKSKRNDREELHRQSSERDSANHSPADMMMASHSLSSISDNHSEGSNDSGKGCSDVATPPPSRKPGTEGGHLDNTTIYEFTIPLDLVGKLIGVKGAFVAYVNNKAKTQIILKRHPTQINAKLCSVQGTQNGVEHAINLIRERFPPMIFPEMTLERFTLTHPVPSAALTDHLYLKLVAGINNDTIVSCMVTPGHLFLQQPTHPTFPSLHILTNCMNLCYATPESPLLPNPIPANSICAAYSVDSWYRAITMSTDHETQTSYVRFLDFGGFAYVQNSMLKQIRGDFLLLPFQAAQCLLANVKPIADNWAEEAYDLVSDLTKGSLVYTQVIEYTDDDIPLVHCYVVSGPQRLIFLNQELVNQGFAEWVSYEDQESSATGTIVPDDFAQTV